MHFVRAIQRRMAFLPRIIVAVVLILVLLSGIAPFSSATAEHLCTMECCAGRAGQAADEHDSDSCHIDMSHAEVAVAAPTPKPEKLCGLPDPAMGTLRSTAARMHRNTVDGQSSFDLEAVTINAAEHSDTNVQSEGAHSSSYNDGSQRTSISRKSLSKPCSQECSTGVISSGTRYSRHTAELACDARLRPPTRGRKYHHRNPNFQITSAHCKQDLPRGPPLSFS